MKSPDTWYVAVVAIMLLQPAALMAHDTGLVYARLEKDSSGGKVTLQASVECLSNPLVPNQEAAREALVTMFDLQNASSENGGVGGGVGVAERTARGKLLGVPQWSVQTEWTDKSVPVSVQGPEDDAEKHCWVTARWELELPKDEAVCLHVNAETKLGALLWEVLPSGQSSDPDGRTRWQILLPGDRSPRLNAPNIARKSEPVVQMTSSRRFAHGWSTAGLGAFVFALAALGAVPLAPWILRRSNRKSWAEIPQEANLAE